MAAKVPLGLPEIPSPLKSIVPFLQRAEEVRSQEPIVAYWCAYYAAQLGIGLKSRDTPSRTFLISLLDCLEQMKGEVGTAEAVEVDAVGSAYVENFAMKVFTAADNEDRAGKATRMTAKKFLAAANFLEVLKTFNNSEISESAMQNIEKIKYAKWKAADIAKAFREGRKPAPGPPGWTEEQEIASQLAAITPADDELTLPSTPSGMADQGTASGSNAANEDWDTLAPPSAPPANHVGESEFSLPEAPSLRPKASVSEELEGKISPGPSPTHSRAPSPPLQQTPSTDHIHPHSAPDPDLHIPGPPSLPPTSPSTTTSLPSPPPSLPSAPSHSSVYYQSPPRRPNPLPPPAPPAPRAPVALTPAVILQAQKYCRLASSALDYEDAATAKRELKAALALLGE